MTTAFATIRFSRTFVGPRALATYATLVVASIPIWPFAWHLTLHVLGALLLIGNAVVMAAWLTRAGFTAGDDRKRRAARAVNRGDVWFTVPGVMLLLLNGVAMASARYGGFPDFLRVGFFAAGLGLLTATALIWAFRLVPAQLALHRLAEAPGALDAAVYRSVLIRWSVWGTVATVLPVLAVIVMSTKPNLW